MPCVDSSPFLTPTALDRAGASSSRSGRRSTRTTVTTRSTRRSVRPGLESDLPWALTTHTRSLLARRSTGRSRLSATRTASTGAPGARELGQGRSADRLRSTLSQLCPGDLGSVSGSSRACLAAGHRLTLSLFAAVSIVRSHVDGHDFFWAVSIMVCDRLTSSCRRPKLTSSRSLCSSKRQRRAS
jgi:hypothetical protein